MPLVQEGTEYRINARYDGVVADVDYGKKDLLTLKPWHGGSNQRFIFIDAGASAYFIVSRYNGRVLGHSGYKPFEARVGWDFRNTHGQRFTLERAERGWVRIVSRATGMPIGKDASPLGSPLFGLEAISAGGRYSENGDLFAVKGIKDLDLPSLRAPEALAGQIGDAPGISSFDDFPPIETRHTLIGEVLVPFLYVNDPLLQPMHQVRETPYYRLVREQFWRQKFRVKEDDADEEVYKYSFEAGMTANTSETLSKVLHLEVGADAGFKFKGISAGFKNKMTRDLAVTTSRSETQMTKETIDITIKRAAGGPAVYALYVLVDRYSLFRMNNTPVEADLPWEIEDPFRYKEIKYTE